MFKDLYHEYVWLFTENHWKNRVIPGVIGATTGVIHGLQHFPLTNKDSDSPINQSEISDKSPLSYIKLLENDPYLTKELLSLIKKYEGFSDKAFWDYDQYSIGYGTKATPDEVKNKTSITFEEANQRLINELLEHKHRILSALQDTSHKLSDKQIQALISFDYNTGKGRRVLYTNKTPKNIANHIAQVVYAGNVKQPGLIKRRIEELELFTGWSRNKIKSTYF